MRNHIFQLLTGLAVVGMTLASCSKIAEDERLIYVAPTTSDDTSDEPSRTQPVRTVLVEDFTGQKCVNCPNGTSIIHDLQQTYGENKLVTVAIHCGNFGLASGLMTDLGQTYWKHWFDDTQGQPVIKINRAVNSDIINDWMTIIPIALNQTTDVAIKLANTYDSQTNSVAINTNILGTAGKKQHLQLWLVEDGIVAIQKMPDGSTNRSYVHNNILRAAVNGDWGEEVTFTADTLRLHHTFTLDSKYVPDNCSIVAFTYDDQGVSQTAKLKIK